MGKDKEKKKAKENEALPYRRGVGIALFNHAGEVFVAQRLDSPGPAWQMPQGGIDKGEAPLDAAWRELQEETGVTSAQLLAESKGWLSYDLPPELAATLWKGKYRGQEQKWYAFRFTGAESEINVAHPAGGHEPEFVDWRWEKLPNLPALVVPFKRKVYERVVAEFAKFA